MPLCYWYRLFRAALLGLLGSPMIYVLGGGRERASGVSLALLADAHDRRESRVGDSIEDSIEDSIDPRDFRMYDRTTS
jgi:hypothetical protein